ncbi:MAG: hypothetical protein K2X99_02785 [Gemmatimonadaceae bacterium]|nr:hypothetical protein [Gemmatimonadaceae bacterium]
MLKVTPSAGSNVVPEAPCHDGVSLEKLVARQELACSSAGDMRNIKRRSSEMRRKRGAEL